MLIELLQHCPDMPIREAVEQFRLAALQEPPSDRFALVGEGSYHGEGLILCACNGRIEIMDANTAVPYDAPTGKLIRTEAREWLQCCYTDEDERLEALNALPSITSIEAWVEGWIKYWAAGGESFAKEDGV